MSENHDKPGVSIFRNLALKRPAEADKEKPSVELAPAMPELGTAPCPVCGHKVAVFVTRTKRPFINCGFCSARIFYNGSRSMQLLQKQLKGYRASIVQPVREPDEPTERASNPQHALCRLLTVEGETDDQRHIPSSARRTGANHSP